MYIYIYMRKCTVRKCCKYYEKMPFILLLRLDNAFEGEGRTAPWARQCPAGGYKAEVHPEGHRYHEDTMHAPPTDCSFFTGFLSSSWAALHLVKSNNSTGRYRMQRDTLGAIMFLPFTVKIREMSMASADLDLPIWSEVRRIRLNFKIFKASVDSSTVASIPQNPHVSALVLKVGRS